MTANPKQSDTPRTDDFEKTIKSWCGDESLCLDFARELEKDNNKLRDTLQLVWNRGIDGQLVKLVREALRVKRKPKNGSL